MAAKKKPTRRKRSEKKRRTRRRKPLQDFTANLPEPVRHFFKEHPNMRRAYTRVSKRLMKIPGVLSVGIGIPWSDRQRKFVPGHRELGGYCLKVYVERKKRGDRLPKEERIPRWIAVEWPGRKAKMRVPTDVVGLGRGTKMGPAVLQARSKGRPWPNARAIVPGRTFSFLRPLTKPRLRAKGSYRRPPPGIQVGTCGALIQFGRTVYASTAGHVFTRPCCGIFAKPKWDCGLGVSGKTYVRVSPPAFFPKTTKPKPKEIIHDAMIIKVPEALVPPPGTPLWPPGFNGKIASAADRHVATQLSMKADSGFVAVERQDKGGAIQLPVKFEGGGPLATPVNCSGDRPLCPTFRPARVWSYGWAWTYRFNSSARSTIGGDSGSAVYLTPQGKDGPVVLLGFHFAEIGKNGYCVDAATYFKVGLGRQGHDWQFYGLPQHVA